VALAERQVRPRQPRRLADRGQQVADEPEVLHLLARHEHDARLPPTHQLELMPGHALLDAPLHRQRRVEVLTHQRVLELGGFGEQRDKPMAAGDIDQRGILSCSRA
jgi:hypothetical protein